MNDFSRHEGLVDHDLLKGSSISGIGTGGAASLYVNLARMGIGHINLVDFDTVSKTNPATQAHFASDVGRLKVEALADQIACAAPATTVSVFPKRVQELDKSERRQVFGVDLLLAMTDCIETQALLNRHVIKLSGNAMFAASYPDAVAVEVSGTFQRGVMEGTGCHHCFALPRYVAFSKDPVMPDVIPSHVLQAEYLNALIGLLAVGFLHFENNSQIGHSDLGKRFVDHPFIISRLSPAFHAATGEAFADTPLELRLFSTFQYPSEAPVGFKCPDCGAYPAGHPPVTNGRHSPQPKEAQNVQ